jgi:hypothetical protein
MQRFNVLKAIGWFAISMASVVVCNSTLAAFVEPTLWQVGDLNTTQQKWSNDFTNFSYTINHAPIQKTSNAPLAVDPVLSWDGPWIAGSGGLYSDSAIFTVSAQIPNHSPSGALGTHILIQTFTTVMPDYDPEGDGFGGGVLRNSIKVYDAANMLVATSTPAQVVRRLTVPGFLGFGGEELLWEVFVPNLTGNFKVSMQSMYHTSFQALRVDSWVSTGDSMAGDFDADGDVDGADFIVWQTNFPLTSNATPSNGDADGDGDVDGKDFVEWQNHFPSAPSMGPSPVPEPKAILVALFGSILISRFYRLKSRRAKT